MRASVECFSQTVGGWVGHWTLDREPPPCLECLFGVLSDWPGCVKQGWDESWEMLWRARDTWKMKLIPESLQWAWSLLNTALLFSVCVSVCLFSLPLLHYSSLQTVHLSAWPVLWPIVFICSVAEKNLDDLRMCFGRCGCEWTKDVILERKYGSKNHMPKWEAFHWRKDVIGGREVYRGGCPIVT